MLSESPAISSRRGILQLCFAAFGMTFAAVTTLAGPVAQPPAGKLYHGFYFGGIGTDTHDPTEHDVSPQDVERYEKAVGAKTAWVYFSDNWFESRKFPETTCSWIRQLGKIPYLRLMLRSDVDQLHSEKVFTLDKINGGAKVGPAKYIAAYRRIVDLMRSEGADNLHWVWHVNWLDEPEQKWNAFENYFPGEKYCDWVALSAYGPTTPRMEDGAENFAFKMREAYPRLLKIAPGRPIIIAEFGCDLRNKHCDAAEWAHGALADIFSEKWPAIVGFCWWNEGWQNDDHKKNDTDMIIWHDANLTRVFREAFACYSDKIQEAPLLRNSTGG